MGQAISQQLSQGFQGIHEDIVTVSRQVQNVSQQVAEIGMHIIDRMDEWGYQIDRDVRYTMMAVRDAKKEIQGSRDLMEFHFETFDQELRVLQNIVKSDLEVIISQNLRRTWTVLADASRGGRSLSSKSKKELTYHFELLVSALRGIDPPTYSFNGYLFNSFHPEIITQVLSGPKENAIGYMFRLLENVLGMSLPTGMHAQDVPNPILFKDGLEKLLTLLEALQECPSDPECWLIDKVIEKCDLLMTFAEFVQNPDVWNKAIAYYRSAYEELLALDEQANVRGSQELSDKLGFHVSLRDTSLSNILTLADQTNKTPHNDFIEADTDSIEVQESLKASRLRLSQSSAAPEIIKALDSAAIVSERLGFGDILIPVHFDAEGYDVEGQQHFKQSNGNILFLGRFKLTAPKMRFGEYYKPIQNAYNLYMENHRHMPLTDGDWKAEREDHARISTQLCRTRWANGQVDVSQFPSGMYVFQNDPNTKDSIQILRSLITQEVVRRRKATATTLMASADWLLARKKLEASILVMHVLGYFAGMSEKKIEEISPSLWTRDNLNTRLQRYMDMGADNGWHLINKDTESLYASLYPAIQSRMPHTIADNPLFGPIQDLRNQLSLFKTTHKKTAEKKAEQSLQTTRTEIEGSTSQELASLRKEITDLRSQIAKMISLMERMNLH